MQLLHCDCSGTSEFGQFDTRTNFLGTKAAVTKRSQCSLKQDKVIACFKVSFKVSYVCAMTQGLMPHSSKQSRQTSSHGSGHIE